MSLPSWERGLKSLLWSLFGSFLIVAPLVGAWIEMFCRLALSLAFASLPSWERGLKCICVVAVIHSGIVAPLVGAWIEISTSQPERA